MKELWFKLVRSIPDDLRKSLLETATQTCDVLFLQTLNIGSIQKRKIRIAASSGDCDIHVLEDLDEKKISKLRSIGRLVAVKVSVKERKDEEKIDKAVNLSSDYIIMDCPNWKIIPMENVIARIHGKSKLLAEASSAKDAKLALEALELGVDGVVLETTSIKEIIKTAELFKGQTPRVELVEAKIVEMEQLGTGARACVDTCDLMKLGEGILVGCQSSGLFLVQAEVYENPHVETRPFRVNAGPVSLYVFSPSNRTRYLSELKSGEEILIVNRKGETRLSNIGRVKIEWRPMMLVKAEYKGKNFKTIVQNAETIRLVTADGSKSVAELKIGERVLMHVTEGGRHFGTLVKEETVIER